MPLVSVVFIGVRSGSFGLTLASRIVSVPFPIFNISGIPCGWIIKAILGRVTSWSAPSRFSEFISISWDVSELIILLSVGTREISGISVLSLKASFVRCEVGAFDGLGRVVE